MSKVVLIYGDEPQLMEEKKRQFLQQHEDMPITTLNDEADPATISEYLCEDSLFGETKLFCLVNLPIFRKSGQKDDPNWDYLYSIILNYSGDNPILILYHDLIDGRIKKNKEFLKKIESIQCKRLDSKDLLVWIQNYCTSHGYRLSPDGNMYLQHLLEIWKDVPVTFMKTEFDRYFLLLGNQKEITKDFLESNSSDYGAKNIYAFKEALLSQNANILLELFPFMLAYKEVNQAIAFIESQLRLQLMVSECRSRGMSLSAIKSFFEKEGSKINKFAISYAFEATPRISIPALETLLLGLYRITSSARVGKGDLLQFRDLCLAYCKTKV